MQSTNNPILHFLLPRSVQWSDIDIPQAVQRGDVVGSRPGLGVAASRLILLAPGVAQQIVAQPDDVLLHDGELVT